MIPFVMTPSGDLHTVILVDYETTLQALAEDNVYHIYFFADLCGPAEPKKRYFVWRENPLIGGEITEAFSLWGREDDPDRLKESIAEQAEVNSEYIYFYVEES